LLPQGISFGGDATSVAVDSEGFVYVFNRGTVPVVVLDQHGMYVESWGAGEFDSPHGIFIDDNDDLYLVDVGGHFVQKRTREGKLLYTLGTRGEAAPVRSGRFFNRPTDVVIHPVTRELFISDGYGNARVHRFSSEGDYIASFGEPGADDGQFCLPHGIELLDDERLIVCDRENFRVQVFSTTGEYLEQWHAHRPSAVRRARLDECLFVAELGYAGQHGAPNMGCRVSVRSPQGEQLTTLGDPLPGFDPGQFFAPHGLSIGPTGDLYVAEVNYSYTTRDLRRDPPRFEPISLRKWRRITE
jgi:sugar lactone lactonase YvrE